MSKYANSCFGDNAVGGNSNCGHCFTWTPQKLDRGLHGDSHVKIQGEGVTVRRKRCAKTSGKNVLGLLEKNRKKDDGPGSWWISGWQGSDLASFCVCNEILKPSEEKIEAIPG